MSHTMTSNTSSIKKSAQTVLAPIAEDLKAVNDILAREFAHSQSPTITEIGSYITQAGGKRMRPALLMLMAKALGYSGNDHRELGATIEMLHTATLMHDDVVDEGMMRRGRPTANAKWGNSVAVLVGDFMYTRSFEMMIRIGNLRVMQALASAANTLSEGEVIQMKNAHDPSVDEARYLKVIERKTSVLFAAAAEMASALAGASKEAEEALVNYTMALGNAFQIADDILDYSGNPTESGKQIGADFEEGKVTLPVIYAMQAANEQDRAFIEKAIRDGHGDFEKISQIIQASGAIERCKARAEMELEKGKLALDVLPPSIFKNSLIELLSFVVELNNGDCRGVAQPGRVLRSGRRSRRFESSHPDHLLKLRSVVRSLFYFLFLTKPKSTQMPVILQTGSYFLLVVNTYFEQ